MPQAKRLGMEAAHVKWAMDGALLGLPRPPTELHLTVLKHFATWVILARGHHGHVEQWRDWASRIATPRTPPVVTSVAAGSALVRATYDRLPLPLEQMLGATHVERMTLAPDGLLMIVSQGPPRQLELFLEGLSGRGPPPRTWPRLTDRQSEALSKAFEGGYYQMPRRQNLRALAKEMGTSATALSEMLRRAEARLVERYVESLAGSSFKPPALQGRPETRGKT